MERHCIVEFLAKSNATFFNIKCWKKNFAKKKKKKKEMSWEVD